MENPELLAGIPLLVIGIVGIAIVLLAGMIPEREAAMEAAAVERHGAHPDAEEYIRIGLALAVLTAIEVALYYIEIQHNVLVITLLVFSAAKFILVVLWFMHLKFDSRIFSTMFVTGFVIAVAAFAVVLATLDGALV